MICSALAGKRSSICCYGCGVQRNYMSCTASEHGPCWDKQIHVHMCVCVSVHVLAGNTLWSTAFDASPALFVFSSVVKGKCSGCASSMSEVLFWENPSQPSVICLLKVSRGDASFSFLACGFGALILRSRCGVQTKVFMKSIATKSQQIAASAQTLTIYSLSWNETGKTAG